MGTSSDFEKNGITSYGLVENDFDLVHGLLKQKALRWDPHGQKKIKRFLYEQYESEFEEREEVLNPQRIEEDLFNHISFRGKQIIYDEEDGLQKNNSEFLQSGTMQY
ncbi:hypothetical protein ACFX19_033161 [Malus domestica]